MSAPHRILARRYATAATIAQIAPAMREVTATGAHTYDIVEDGWTEWYVVPEDDPRVNTVVVMHER